MIIVPYLLCIDIALQIVLHGVYVSTIFCALLLHVLAKGVTTRAVGLISGLLLHSLLIYDRFDYESIYTITVFFCLLLIRHFLYIRAWYCGIILALFIFLKSVCLQWLFFGNAVSLEYSFIQICANIGILVLFSLIWQKCGIAGNRL